MYILYNSSIIIILYFKLILYIIYMYYKAPIILTEFALGDEYPQISKAQIRQGEHNGMVKNNYNIKKHYIHKYI